MSSILMRGATIVLFGSNNKRVIRIFLIAFGLFGYGVCIPLTYFANSALLLLPPSLSGIQSNLEGLKQLTSEAETMLTSVSMSLDGVILGVSLFDFASTINTINSTFHSIDEMLNETEFLLDSIEQILNENANWLTSLANNTWILLVAPTVASEAESLATSMQYATEILNNLLIKPTIDSLNTLQPYINAMFTQIEDSIDFFVNQLQMFKVYIESIGTRLENAKLTIDEWIANIQSIHETTWIIRIGVYGCIVYILMLHTAFLLLGIALRK